MINILADYNFTFDSLSAFIYFVDFPARVLLILYEHIHIILANFTLQYHYEPTLHNIYCIYNIYIIYTVLVSFTHTEIFYICILLT